jgi:gamma-glutamylcyclotransferase (GGCT)/AIG2-like uncharacterized protein YtfP
MTKIACYGTLKQGHYNHKYFARHLTLISEQEIEGFQMFNLGHYPCVVRTNNPEDKITVQLMDCDKQGFDKITEMELNAGYVIEKVMIGDTIANIFTFTNTPAHARRIETGNWI